MLKKYCKLGINYIIYFPENVKENMPLLLFLHGIGERGEKVEDRVKTIENFWKTGKLNKNSNEQKTGTVSFGRCVFIQS